MSSGDVDWETARLLGLKGNPPKGGATPAAGGCDCSPSRDRLALIAEHGYSHSEGDDGRCVLCGDEWACDGWTQQIVQDHCEREIGPLADELRRVTAELQQAQQRIAAVEKLAEGHDYVEAPPVTSSETHDEATMQQIIEAAREFFPDDDLAAWLDTPNRLLGGQRAIELCKTAEGRVRVLAVFSALADGAFV